MWCKLPIHTVKNPAVPRLWGIVFKFCRCRRTISSYVLRKSKHLIWHWIIPHLRWASRAILLTVILKHKPRADRLSRSFCHTCGGQTRRQQRLIVNFPPDHKLCSYYTTPAVSKRKVSAYKSEVRSPTTGLAAIIPLSSLLCPVIGKPLRRNSLEFSPDRPLTFKTAFETMEKLNKTEARRFRAGPIRRKKYA